MDDWKVKTLKAKEYVNPDIPESRYWPRGDPDTDFESDSDSDD